MSFVNITKENGTPTKAQKHELIAGVTNLLAEVLGKNKASTVNYRRNRHGQLWTRRKNHNRSAGKE